MARKILTLALLLSIVFASNADAQRWRSRRAMGYIGIGTANVYGDIGGSLTRDNLYGLKDFDIQYTRPSIAAGAKYKLNHRFNARVNLAAAYLQGSDKNALNYESRYGNGYRFNSFIFEPSAMAEFYIIPESRSMVSQAIYNRKGMINGFRSIYLYAFAGAGGLIIRPNVTYMEDGYNNSLNKQVSEGDPVLGKDDSGNSFDDGFFYNRNETNGPKYEHKDTRFGAAIPFGIGAKMNLTAYISLHVELGRRYTLFTDYVDGYTSYISKSNDVYDFLNVMLSYKLKTDVNGVPILFKRRGMD